MLTNIDHSGHSIQLGDFVIDNLKPIKEGVLVTKVGRISFTGTYDGKLVKIYECHNSKHAQSIQKITNASGEKKYFPYTYGVHNNLIISEWLPGRILKPKKIAKNVDYVTQISEFFKTLHRSEVKKSYGFDYFEDHIHPRFKRCCDTLGLHAFYERIQADYLVIKGVENVKTLSHPDITPANILISPEGQIQSIDNELLSTSTMPFFDYFNVIHGFGVSIKQNAALWSDVFAPVKPYMTPEYEDALMSLWVMRIAGSYFVSGRFDKILKLANTSHDDLKSTLRLWDILTTVCKE